METQPPPAASFPFRWGSPRDPGRIVRGRVALPAGSGSPPPCCLLLHGFKGFMDWGFFPLLASELTRNGIATVRFNFTGSGIGDDLENFTEDEAFAKDTLTRQLEDVEDVRSWLEREGPELDLGRVGLFGHSRGGGIALVHASERGDYRALVTWASIPDIDRFDEATLSLWREQGYILIPNSRTGRDHRIDIDMLHDVEHNRERLDIPAACGRLRTPALLVHGSDDAVVEPEALGLLSEAFPPGMAETLAIEEANHTLGAKPPPDRSARHLAARARCDTGVLRAPSRGAPRGLRAPRWSCCSPMPST